MVLELAKLIGLLASTIQAVLPAQLNLFYLQQQKKHSLKLNGSFQGLVGEQVVNGRTAKVDSKFETLQWLVDNATSMLR